MYWRAHTQQYGDHIHVRLFVAENNDRTFAGIGQLTMRKPEWDDLRSRLNIEVTQRETDKPPEFEI